MMLCCSFSSINDGSIQVNLNQCSILHVSDACVRVCVYIVDPKRANEYGQVMQPPSDAPAAVEPAARDGGVAQPAAIEGAQQQ